MFHLTLLSTHPSVTLASSRPTRPESVGTVSGLCCRVLRIPPAGLLTPDMCLLIGFSSTVLPGGFSPVGSSVHPQEGPCRPGTFLWSALPDSLDCLRLQPAVVSSGKPSPTCCLHVPQRASHRAAVSSLTCLPLTLRAPRGQGPWLAAVPQHLAQVWHSSSHLLCVGC